VTAGPRTASMPAASCRGRAATAGLWPAAQVSRPWRSCRSNDFVIMYLTNTGPERPETETFGCQPIWRPSWSF